MATEFLKKRMASFLGELAGSETVQYIPFDSNAKDSLTGDVDESTAYASTPVFLSAIIDFNPSRGVRESLGMEIEFEATLLVAKEHVEEKGLTFNLGDAFILPGSTEKYYITRVVSQYQSGNTFLGRLLAVSHKVGRR